MPLPSPQKKQSKEKFISSCMGNETMKNEFPNQKQRSAVCYSKYKQSRKKAKGSEVIWDDGEVDDDPYILY